MLLEFKTRRNANGNRKYLAIDTEARVYSTFNRRYIMEGVQISAYDYNDMLRKCENLGFEKRETAIF